MCFRPSAVMQRAGLALADYPVAQLKEALVINLFKLSLLPKLSFSQWHLWHLGKGSVKMSTAPDEKRKY